MPISIEKIKEIHFELSSICNARCPLCPRNFFGYPRNQGYVETNLSLDLIKKSFSKEFILQLDRLLISGNFGDMVSNLETVEIFKYFLENNPRIKITASTNGSARNQQFWEDLGKLPILVEFCLDGLEDTHHLYRQDTDWHKIIRNATTYIKSGGKARWKMIKFNHNQHQIEDCKKLALELGFKDFELIDEKRDTGPVFNKDGTLSHVLGNYTSITDLKELMDYWDNPGDLFYFENNITVNCYSKSSRSIFVSAEGKVYPCCFLGFQPQNYKGTVFKLFNEQAKLVENNNDLHKTDLLSAMSWFTAVEDSWTKENSKKGRLLTCDYSCGKCEESRHQRQVVSEKF